MDNNGKRDWSKNHPPAWQIAAILAAVVAVLCAALGLVYFGIQTWRGLRQEQQVQATATVVTATVVAQEQYTLVRQAAQWPLVFGDDFEADRGDWVLGPVDDEYSTIQVEINGRYLWDATAKRDFIWRVWPTAQVVDDFYLAVEAHNLGDNLDMQYGLLFLLDDNAYYYFEVRDSGYLRLFSVVGQEWHELLPYTESAAIRAGQPNRLEVVNLGDRFTLLINGEIVGQSAGSFPARGQAGLVIGLAQAGESGLIAFDNYELRAPQEQP
jgi:hypothetical protein